MTGWCVTEAVPLVVFVVGNGSRGDDGLGPALLSRIEPKLPPDARVVVDFQLQVEHAFDLYGAALALFIDAECGLEAPFAFREADREGDDTAATFSHALSPVAVLDVFRRVEQAPPPPAFVLGIRAVRFELGEGLSPSAEADLEIALAFLRPLLERPVATAWRKTCQARRRSCPRSGKNIAV